MIVIKKTFKGGYRFKNLKGAPAATVEALSSPKQVRLPLKRNYGHEVQPLVEKGDTVQTGQIIGRDDEVYSSPIHAPISGTVTSIQKGDYLGEKVSYVTIENDHKDGPIERIPGCDPEWQNLTKEQIEELIYLSGAAAGGSGIPTHQLSAPIVPEEVESIIFCSGESDLYQPSPSVLLRGEMFARFVDAVKIVTGLYPGIDVSIAVNDHNTDLIGKLTAELEKVENITIVKTKAKYPQEREEMLVPTVLGREYPYGYPAIHLGVLVLSIQTALDLHTAVTKGIPVVNRTISLGGEGFINTCHIDVPIGTPVEEIIENRTIHGESRIIRNSVNTGDILEDLSSPVLWDTDAIIAVQEGNKGEMMSFAMPGFKKDSVSGAFPSSFLPFKKSISTNIRGEQRACIQCGFCIEVCPVRLYPNLLYRYVERDIIEDSLASFKIFDCIDCNLCSYVCTSKLPLSQLIKEGKNKLRQEGVDPAAEIAEKYKLKGVSASEGLDS
jgi:Na+-translocating ferredoxin:NAD+ oxidoreductase subunit C